MIYIITNYNDFIFVNSSVLDIIDISKTTMHQTLLYYDDHIYANNINSHLKLY